MLWLDNAPHSGLSMLDGATQPGLSMLDGATHPAALRPPSPRGDGAAALY